jgi:hypothetical protein
MAEPRIRLSERARQRLYALSDQANLEPSFLLEYLINRHGSDAIQLLTGQNIPIAPVSDTTPAKPVPNDSAVHAITPVLPSNGKKPRPPIEGLS